MKTIYAAILLLTLNSYASAKDGRFTGEVMDKQCAQMGSHQNMMKSEGAKDARECTLACTKNGDSFALLEASTKKVYVIADGNKVRPYAGQHVQITGSYDETSDTLHVKSIAAQ
jgi:hypothetical protein